MDENLLGAFGFWRRSFGRNFQSVIMVFLFLMLF